MTETLTGWDLARMYLYAAAAMSVVAWIMFATDKIRAVCGKRRISESMLLLPGVLLGAFGSLFGMVLFNHKTRKPLFYVAVPVLTTAQIALAAYIMYYL